MPMPRGLGLIKRDRLSGWRLTRPDATLLDPGFDNGPGALPAMETQHLQGAKDVQDPACGGHNTPIETRSIGSMGEEQYQNQKKGARAPFYVSAVQRNSQFQKSIVTSCYVGQKIPQS